VLSLIFFIWINGLSFSGPAAKWINNPAKFYFTFYLREDKAQLAVIRIDPANDL